MNCLINKNVTVGELLRNETHTCCFRRIPPSVKNQKDRNGNSDEEERRNEYFL